MSCHSSAERAATLVAEAAAATKNGEAAKVDVKGHGAQRPGETPLPEGTVLKHVAPAGMEAANGVHGAADSDMGRRETEARRDAKFAIAHDKRDAKRDAER